MYWTHAFPRLFALYHAFIRDKIVSSLSSKEGSNNLLDVGSCFGQDLRKLLVAIGSVYRGLAFDVLQISTTYRHAMTVTPINSARTVPVHSLAVFLHPSHKLPSNGSCLVETFV